MYLRKNRRPDGRIHLAICKSFRDPITKKGKQKVIQKLGYLNELEKRHDDPISYFEALAQQMSNEEKEGMKSSLNIDHSKQMTETTNKIKNIGFCVLSKIYHELGIHKFLIILNLSSIFQSPL